MPANNILHLFRKHFHERHVDDVLLFTTIGVVSAMVCSFYAWIFHLAEKNSHSFFLTFPVASYFLGPLGLMLSFSLVRFLAPGASGSGIPQVLACIEIKDGNLLYAFLRKIVAVVKITSNVIAVFVGAATGREGPSLQIAASVSYNIGKFSERFGIKAKTDQLLVAGAAGGLAAAFNTPIGGVVFAIEELSKEHVRNFRDVLLLSVVIAGISSQLINGSYLFLGTPVVGKNYSLTALSLVMITSLLCGLLGGLFTKILLILLRWREKQTLRTQFFVVAAVGLCFVCVYHNLGPRHLYSGKESIHVVLFGGDSLAWYESLTRFFLPLATSATGVAGGIFAPALSAGAVIGGTIAEFVRPELMVVLGLSGMIGFLTGVTHTPITSFILVLEMTDRHTVVLPMMLAALCSSIGAHMVGKSSFYEEVVEDIRKKTELK